MKKENQKDAYGLTPELRAEGWLSFDEWQAERMRDPEYTALWDADEPIRQAMFARVAARIEKEQRTKEEGSANKNNELKLGLTT